MTGYDAAAATARLAVAHEQMPLGTLLGTWQGLQRVQEVLLMLQVQHSRSAGDMKRLPEAAQDVNKRLHIQQQCCHCWNK
jgi:hypothetical protein